MWGWHAALAPDSAAAHRAAVAEEVDASAIAGCAAARRAVGVVGDPPAYAGGAAYAGRLTMPVQCIVQ